MNERKLIEQRYAGCQSFLQEGCLFLSLCSIAEEVRRKPVDILDALAQCRKLGWVDELNNMAIDGQPRLLHYLTGLTWKREVLKKLPSRVPDEMYTIEKWVNPATRATHFRRRYVDTLKNSVTVQQGTLDSYYTYSIL